MINPSFALYTWPKQFKPGKVLTVVNSNWCTCDTMGGIRFCGCKCLSEDPFVCFGTKPTQRACTQDFPRDWKRTKEGRSQNRKKQRTGKSTEGGRQQKSAEQNRAVNRREQSREVRGSQLLGPVNPEARLANVREWVSVPGGFVGILFEYTFTIVHRCTESYTKVSQTFLFLHLELTQVHDCLFLFSSTILVVYVVFCVFVKKCEMPVV